MDELWTAEEASQYLRVHKETIYRWVTRRQMPFIKLPHGIRFRRSDIDRWLAKRSSLGRPVRKGLYLEANLDQAA
ncbi:MAG: hypothetical protein A3G33_06010 [Omnitrophica bacterium RIFCSPLOWO2_12_FULL_44_17]|uniref:Helix-turn-helix domain-containing protein n=1 Tax=Candidatus Danuiimicrobium aquiferis TaxID=1801832 RepID=A0A1G1L2F7_9BACT|nr:MAG: hypothetical protein A3B72_06240 [Omnitrophica bacterium RIFCSPHIGHO2_02_FULL_45_28]OGW89558.1 MAG: hypothetical protein A3E74_09245 [Omnitrophica bacterium RIFCSPHIGHO2_12_FULL_44_12]OGW99343.1 MAG: hypothetical protein A3G33_06010 [Omnitrophica bacterium RIFCSPLOWO2_12_FULL_44_17]OGX05105.1 MAG: hypothetical protein A3J12_06720 [Omnitrophica bacterium RIFCSPLOWO2_02_FULL_44_11]